MRGHLAILSAPMLTALAACSPVLAKAPASPSGVPTTVGADFRVSGDADLVVSHLGMALGNDQGLIAKRQAEAYCAAEGRVLHPASLGRFQAGTWVFPGGCA